MEETHATSAGVRSVDFYVDPVSDDVKYVIQITNYVTVCVIISFVGVGANIVNIIVFVKQGFKDSINISLLSLAVADLACSITMLWACLCDIPLFDHLDLPFVFLDVMYVTGGWPHVCFNRVTSLITAFISLERCLCIAMPLKVKNIITPFRTKVTNVSIYLSMIALFSPFYFVTRLEHVFNASRNRSILSITFTREREIVDSVTYFIHSVLLSTALLLSVIICTIILVVKLRNKTRWRKESVLSTAEGFDVTSNKEKKVIKLIILISTIFIICYIPPTVSFLAMAFFPEFSINGAMRNTFFVTWSVEFILEAFNSCVNFFLYFKMSSKFKVTLCEICCGCWKNQF